MDVILVNPRDREKGRMEKLQAHRLGLLHRAFSVFVFNTRGEMLLQKRALKKYHSGGLWTNACCSHPMPGEEITAAANRRLKEETGLSGTLEPRGTFIYHAVFANGLTEYELDHVYTMRTDQQPVLNEEEAEAYEWTGLNELRARVIEKPHEFTIWFRIALAKFF